MLLLLGTLTIDFLLLTAVEVYDTDVIGYEIEDLVAGNSSHSIADEVNDLVALVAVSDDSTTYNELIEEDERLALVSETLFLGKELLLLNREQGM